MVGLLLDFLVAEGDTTYDQAYDHLKYFKWRTIYYINTVQLSPTYPDLNDAYLRGFHTVSRIKIPNKPNCVFTDMALEQTINRDIKTKKEILCYLSLIMKK